MRNTFDVQRLGHAPAPERTSAGVPGDELGGKETGLSFRVARFSNLILGLRLFEATVALEIRCLWPGNLFQISQMTGALLMADAKTAAAATLPIPAGVVVSVESSSGS